MSFLPFAFAARRKETGTMTQGVGLDPDADAITTQFRHLSLIDEILPAETTLSEEQSIALEKIVNGENCYVYGAGGTGKTVLLQTAVKRLREDLGKTVAVTATTGIAAEAIDGVTIHSVAGCGVVKNIHFLGKVSGTQREVIQTYDVLFIDEISMLSGEMFDRLSEHFGIIRQRPTEPFGGCQVIVMGDFLQLQPIEQLKTANLNLRAVCPAMMLDRGLCFQSFTWDVLNFAFCELKQVFRQEDEHFASLLSRVRRGDPQAGSEIDEYVKSQRNLETDDDRHFEMKLVSTNKEANAFNTLKLNELETEEQIYEAVDSEEPCVDVDHDRYDAYCESLRNNWRHLKGNMRAEEKVTLKVGCEVMMLLNASVLPGTTAAAATSTTTGGGETRRLANGSRGRIVKFDIPEFEEAMTSHIETLEKEPNTKQREIDLLKRQRDWVKRAVQNKQKIPYVLFNGFDEAIPILPMEFSFDTAGLGKNVRLQIPIKLAFAITVHKSQGMSLDSCFVDASKVFAEAQVYVALSRCRSAAGLQIENLKPTKIKAPQDALDFYNHLREPNTYLPNTHKWWQGRPGPKSQRERAAVRILRQYYDPLREEYPDGSFSEYLSVRHDRMRKLASDEQLETVPGWRCRACNHRRDYSLECCFLAREQVDRDIDENVFASWSQRRNSSSSGQGEETPCPKCPKSGGPQACPECSPENFCFLTEHGNSRDAPSAKTMCPKCSPQNFCRDAEHGQSEESPAHKSSCVKCSPEYFGCVENPNAFRNPGSTRV